MKVAKDDGYRKEDQIWWFSKKEAMQLDIFGDQHPNKLDSQGVELIVVWPLCCGFVGQPEYQRIENERERREGSKM